MVPPHPIPNWVVKRTYADGTYTAGCWESRETRGVFSFPRFEKTQVGKAKMDDSSTKKEYNLETRGTVVKARQQQMQDKPVRQVRE